jgi:hypothetical protein
MWLVCSSAVRDSRDRTTCAESDTSSKLSILRVRPPLFVVDADLPARLEQHPGGGYRDARAFDHSAGLTSLGSFIANMKDILRVELPRPADPCCERRRPHRMRRSRLRCRSRSPRDRTPVPHLSNTASQTGSRSSDRWRERKAPLALRTRLMPCFQAWGASRLAVCSGSGSETRYGRCHVWQSAEARRRS